MQNVIKKIKNKIKFLSWRLLYVLDFFTFSLPQVVISIIGTSLIVEFCETLFGEKPSLSFAQDVKVLWIKNLFWVNYCTFVTSSTLFSFACKTASKPSRSKKLYFRIRFWHKTHLSIDESTWNWRENYFFNFISSMWPGYKQREEACTLLILLVKWSKEFDGDWGQLSVWINTNSLFKLQ